MTSCQTGFALTKATAEAKSYLDELMHIRAVQFTNVELLQQHADASAADRKRFERLSAKLETASKAGDDAERLSRENQTLLDTASDKCARHKRELVDREEKLKSAEGDCTKKVQNPIPPLTKDFRHGSRPEGTSNPGRHAQRPSRNRKTAIGKGRVV
jgi:hypothetical protein